MRWLRGLAHPAVFCRMNDTAQRTRDPGQGPQPFTWAQAADPSDPRLPCPRAPEALLACGVPELQLDGRPGRQLQFAAVELDAHRGIRIRLGLRCPGRARHVAPQQRRLAHGRVPQQRDAKLVAASALLHGPRLASSRPRGSGPAPPLPRGPEGSAGPAEPPRRRRTGCLGLKARVGATRGNRAWADHRLSLSLDSPL